MACVAVSQSDQHLHEGRYALEMKMDLVAGDPRKSKGEAFTELGKEGPINLRDKTISAWIYVPKGSLGSGESPNGFQIFVKDSNFKCEYGTWYNIDWEDEWFQVFLPVSASPPDEGYMTEGFDPNAVVEIGIKMGAGGKSKATYKGSVYVDEVNW